MAIEQIMFFVLGFLAASLLAIVVLPSVWKRAVRLTKKRIEAATPITMTEFRAEKDQMRAQFALETRKLERTIETLRTRVTEQLSVLNTAQSEMAVAKAERNRSLAVQAELEERADASNERIRELEKEAASLSQLLRGRNREIDELANLVEPEGATMDQSTTSAISTIRRALAFGEKQTFDDLDGIKDAYTRISSAGSELDSLVEEKEVSLEPEQSSLAERLSQEDALEVLHDKISHVQNAISAPKGLNGNRDALRTELEDIASSVSAIVYEDDAADDDVGESLFDRIRKFAGESLGDDDDANAPPISRTKKSMSDTSVTDRMTGFGDIHTNG